MLPYILAAIGGYLIGDSQPTSFADGGQTEEAYRWITYRTANTDEGFRNFYSSQGNRFGSLDTVIKYIQDNWDYAGDEFIVEVFDDVPIGILKPARSKKMIEKMAKDDEGKKNLTARIRKMADGGMADGGKTLTAEERKYMLNLYSDFHKDAYGFRPRGFDWTTLSDEQLNADWNRFGAALEQRNIEEATQEESDLKEWKDLVQHTIDLGANDRKTAIKWLFDGEGLDSDNPQDLEHFVWRKGILFTDEGKEVVKELGEIYYGI